MEMDFSMRQAKCKICGGFHLVPAGKLSGMGYDDCLKCREKQATQDALDGEEFVISADGASERR